MNGRLVIAFGIMLACAACGEPPGASVRPEAALAPEPDAPVDRASADTSPGARDDAAPPPEADAGATPDAGAIRDLAGDPAAPDLRDTGAILPDAASMSWEPCPPAGSPCRIMAAGDSIAVGIGGTGGGYRLPLFRRARQAGQNVTFVGSLVEGPATADGVPFPRQHEGHRGHTIEAGADRMGVAPLLGPAVTTHRPHIVLLMIGTNDLTVQLDLANAPARLGALIDRVIAAAPDALLVVAQIVPTMDDVQNQRIRTFNAAIPALVAARAGAGKHVALVDMYGAFTARTDYKTSLMFDRVHPKDAGYQVMSDVWYQAIGNRLR